MTYQEAKSMKQQFGPKTNIGGLEYYVLIAPVKTHDLVKFLSGFTPSDYNDDDCIKYSSDENYQVYFYVTEVSRSGAHI